MKIDFIVGEQEKHQMQLSFDQVTGELHLLMDGAPVLHDAPRLVMKLHKDYALAVGDRERHMLALRISYGAGESEPGVIPALRLSLAVHAALQNAVPESLGLNGTDSLLAARTAATV